MRGGADAASTFARAVADAFDLGVAASAPTPVAGGLTHRMWRLVSDRGAFAVKVIAPDPDGPWTPWRIERAFRLERAAFGAGISMPRPVPGRDGHCLAEITHNGVPSLVRVHEWVDGEALRRAVYGADALRDVARVIARIHGLGMPAAEGRDASPRPRGAPFWDELAERVERSHVPWRWEFRGILHTVADLEAYVAAADAGSDAPLILGHRDADQKNWLKTRDGQLLLVDWDAAGPVHPRHEVASLALTWAGVHLGEPDWNAVRAWIRSYREAGGGDSPIAPGDLGEFVAVALGWFAFNVRRVLDGGDAADLAEGIVGRAFKDLPRYRRSLERWERVLGDE